MTIEHKKIIDIVGVDETKNEVVLTIVDHLDWSIKPDEHLILLQEKLNDYLAFIESGEINKKYPKAKYKNIIIEVLGTFSLNDMGKKFYDKSSVILSNAGFELRFTILQK